MNSQPPKNPEVKDLGISKILEEYESLAEVKVKFSAQLGGCKMLVRDLLNLDKDSVIQLDRLAGDTADLLINGVPIARGEVIMIGQSFGIRITEFLTVEK